MLMTDKVLRIHVLPKFEIDIVPAPVTRAWMDATPERHAYRCLPLKIVNAHGWQILNPSTFRVRWGGGIGREALTIDGARDDKRLPAYSHFGSGLVTFHVPALITPPPGYATFVTGLFNGPRDDASALSGVVETDWLPFTFTMNWQLEKVDQWVVFEKGEPFCMFFPVRLDEIESWKLEISELPDDVELFVQYRDYAQSRTAFITDLLAKRGTKPRDEWQRHYLQGQFGDARAVEHRTSLKLATPIRREHSDD